ncbi:hypothetical protein Dsin_030644 [Dipteronia sinensis]|uniref:C2HC NPR-type domain-containing protein n=1 Tax=Dipteronia sinensis TaxID=43782 RepID=A0AAD9ZKG0_9ROSI|nr:hypothetical protein Dsin_030644 [Dipteronia sinensis]
MKRSPPEVSTCVDEACIHDACLPAITYAVELINVSATFQIKELVLLFQEKNPRTNDDLLSAYMNWNRSFLTKISCIHAAPGSKLCREGFCGRCNPGSHGCIPLPTELASLSLHPDDSEKRTRRIHMTLDSDDIELLRFLLNESDAY